MTEFSHQNRIATPFVPNLEEESFNLPPAQLHRLQYSALLEQAGQSEAPLAAFHDGRLITDHDTLAKAYACWLEVKKNIGEGKLVFNPQTRLAVFIDESNKASFLQAVPDCRLSPCPCPELGHPKDIDWAEDKVLRWKPKFDVEKQWPYCTRIFEARYESKVDLLLAESDNVFQGEEAINRLGAIFDARALTRLVRLSSDHTVLFSTGWEKGRLRYFAAPMHYELRGNDCWYNHDATETRVTEITLSGGAAEVDKVAGSYFRGTLGEDPDSPGGLLRLDMPGTEEMQNAYCKRKGIPSTEFAQAITTDFAFVINQLLLIVHAQKPVTLLDNLRELLAARGVVVEKTTALGVLAEKLKALC